MSTGTGGGIVVRDMGRDSRDLGETSACERTGAVGVLQSNKIWVGSIARLCDQLKTW